MTDPSHSPGAPQPHMNPYWAGFGLGLVLLAAFVVMGRGLGASGAFGSVTATVLGKVAPAHAAHNAFFARYLARDAGICFVIAKFYAGAAFASDAAITAGR